VVELADKAEVAELDHEPAVFELAYVRLYYCDQVGTCGDVVFKLCNRREANS